VHYSFADYRKENFEGETKAPNKKRSSKKSSSSRITPEEVEERLLKVAQLIEE